jgi:hypothetical protein
MGPSKLVREGWIFKGQGEIAKTMVHLIFIQGARARGPDNKWSHRLQHGPKPGGLAPEDARLLRVQGGNHSLSSFVMLGMSIELFQRLRPGELI